MAEIYGTIGIRPMGEYNPDTKYELLNLVNYDGSSYVAHTEPPVGTLPTNMAYWQVSAQGTSKATADSVGTVKPDGVTTEVNTDGVLSAKIATQSTTGMVKGSPGITVGTGGAIDVNTAFTQATELANIIAGEAIAQVLGKISKSIATTMNLDQNALLKNMLTNMDANDSSKIPTSAFIHTLVERIGMGEDLDIGDNLTAAFNALNSNLTLVSNNLGGMKFYTSASAIGVDLSTITTLSTIVNAMPDNSMLMCATVEAMYTKSLVPTLYGYIKIEKVNNNRVRLYFSPTDTVNVSSVFQYIAVWDTVHGFTSWRAIGTA